MEEQKLQKELVLESDAELVLKTLQNSNNYVFLVERYQKPLSIYIQRISGLPFENIQDILQEVFLKAYKNLRDFDSSMSFSSWLYRITRNTVISEYRKSVSRRESMNIELDDKIANKIVFDFDIKSKIDQNILFENIKLVFKEMKQEYKEVLMLYYFEQKDYKEISDILKKPMGSIATMLNRAKKEFKKISQQKSIRF